VQQLLPIKTNTVNSLNCTVRQIIKFETNVTNLLYYVYLSAQFPASCALSPRNVGKPTSWRGCLPEKISLNGYCSFQMCNARFSQNVRCPTYAIHATVSSGALTQNLWLNLTWQKQFRYIYRIKIFSTFRFRTLGSTGVFKSSNSWVHSRFLGCWYTDREGPLFYDGSKTKAQISFETSAGVTSRHISTFHESWISSVTVVRASNLQAPGVSRACIIVDHETGWAAFKVLWLCVGSLSREPVRIKLGRLRNVHYFINFLLSFVVINLKNSNIVCALSGGNVINTCKAVSSLLGKQSTYFLA
jgi:hypothetical protein